MSTDPERLDRIVRAAEDAASTWRASSLGQRAAWLRAVADALDAHVDELVPIADRETRLGETRLRGEVARTSGQLRMFADVVEEGSWLELSVDDRDPKATPPRPELRRMLTGLGPVAVFAASNFPFAFSVCGGDTASALAAGNPVVVKAHPGHPELSRRTAEIAAAALEGAGAPSGSLGLVEGQEAGEALVRHPLVRAAGFTGSLAGGRALFDLAVGRPDPIPFHGELGSLNPVVLTPAAVGARGDELARGLAGSFTLGVGQFCTKPGVVFVPRGAGFEASVAAAVSDIAGGRLLTDKIADGFSDGLDRMLSDPSVEVAGRGAERASGASAGRGAEDVSGRADAAALGHPVDGDARPVVLATDAVSVTARPGILLEECFGPVVLLVRYDDEAQLRRALEAVPGSLTATLHAEEPDEVGGIVELLERRAGRVLFAGWPTGVAVAWAQHHGGPWPATTSLHTSVGATAIRRFLRPVVYQDAPGPRLPDVLRDESLASLPHRRNGVLKTR